MRRYILQVIVYILSYVLAMYGLSALNFEKFIRSGKVQEARVLYVLLAMALAYLVGSLLMSVIYYFAI